MTYIDPLVLDLDGGGVGLTDWRTAPVLFDIDKDGSRELTGWVRGGDGIVVQDLNGNGIIDDISEALSEYYGATSTTKTFRDGFAALASLDKAAKGGNGDGKITAADAAFALLRVWVDANHDGRTDASELKTFATLGITEISLGTAAQSGELRDGNEVLSRGTFIRNGVAAEAVAVNFLADPRGTVSTTGNVVRSEGNAQSTYVVTNQAGEVVNLAALPGDPVNAALGGAGNDSITGTSGDDWLAGGLGRDTLLGGAGDDVFLVDAADDLMALRGGAGLDVVKVVGDDGVAINLSQTEVEVFEGGRGGDYVVGGGLTNVFVRGGDGDDVLVGGKADDALSGEEGNDILDGWEGDDLLRGHNGRDLLLGGLGNDVLQGGRDDDALSGGGGNDVLNGGQGDDQLDGGDGIDVAEYRGSYADYRIQKNADGSYYVRDTRSGRDGFDHLTNIEKITFADISSVDLSLPSPLPVKDVLTLSGTGAQVISAAQLLANDQDWQGDVLHITAVMDARGGTAVLQSNGNVLFTPDPSFGGVRGFRYTVADATGHLGANVIQVATGASAEMKGSVYLLSPDMPTDPLLAEQWYLTDTNVLPVWRDYTGEGVKVGVFESAGDFAVQREIFDTRHPDLAPNVDPEFLASGDAIPSFSNHATLVAGVIGAARNGEGSVGVAYNASLVGYSFTPLTDGPSGQYNFGLDVPTVLWRMSEVDVANNSWGSPDHFSLSFRANVNLQNAFLNAVANGRDGLGTNVVFAAGNDRAAGGNTNLQNLTNNPYAITVGAVNVQSDLGALILGNQPFSAPGATILVSAPGSNVASTSRLLLNDNGSVFGADQTTAQGTSFAVPLVSGIVALMLEANKNLGYRDVQEILSLSTRLVDVNGGGWAWNDARTFNGGGIRISHSYGFGEVDARAAVRLAESWSGEATYWNEYKASASSGVLNDAIPNGTGALVKTLNLGNGIDIEHVKVTLKLSHAQLGDLVVKLIAPGGTESILLNRTGVDRAANGTFSTTDRGDGGTTLEFDLGSVLHRGEASGGSWQLRIEDMAAAATGTGAPSTGTLTGWDIEVSGKSGAGAAGDDVYVYTDEFWQQSFYGTTAEASRLSLVDTGGWNVLNAAAITANVTLSLASGATSYIGGRPVTIGATTVIADAIGGDGNDTLTGNQFGNRLIGGRGNDTLSGGDGDDLLDGGRGADQLTGGNGRDLFVLRYESAASTASPITDTVTDFNAAAGDRIAIVGFAGVTSLAGLTIVQDGTAARISTGTGQSLLLHNTTASALNAANFYFADELNASGVRLGTAGNDALPAAADYLSRPTIVLGGAGNDTINGLNNADDLRGEDGNDVLFGDLGSAEGGRDKLHGGAGDDVLIGDSGDDLLSGDSGLDHLEGGDGNDTIILDGDRAIITANNYGGQSIYAVAFGQAGSDRFVIMPGSLLPESEVRNLIQDFEVGNADEKIDLSFIPNVYTFEDLSFGYMLQGGVGGMTVYVRGSSFGPLVTLANVTSSESLRGKFIFAPKPEPTGTAGADILLGTAGGTTLDGGAGADRLEGRTGDDTYVVDNPGDVVIELAGGGYDTVRSSINYTLPDQVENIVLTGAFDTDAAGNAERNRLTGNAGNNTLDGGLGIDWMAGGAGDDIYFVDDTADEVSEKLNEGTDTIRSSVSYLLPSNVENLTLIGVGDVSAIGNSVSNHLTGNSGSNVFIGAEGDDRIDGGAGYDVAGYFGARSDYLVTKLTGGDILVRNIGNSHGEGGDVLRGIEEIRFSNAVLDTASPTSLDVFAGYLPMTVGSTAFGNNQGWNTSNYPRQLADVNGDGRTDIVGFGGAATYVALATASGQFGPMTLAISDFGEVQGWSTGSTPRQLADVNGDGRADIVGFGATGTYVALATASGQFGPRTLATTDFSNNQGWNTSNYPRQLADVNGDGRTDIVGFGGAATYVALATASGQFGPMTLAISDFGEVQGWSTGSTPRQLADVNGDGRADIVGFGATGTYVALATASGQFGPRTLATTDFSNNQGWNTSNYPRQLADVNGDGRTDIVGFGGAATYVALATASGQFGPMTLAISDFGEVQGWSTGSTPRQLADVNGDGRADIVGFGGTGTYVALATASGQFGPRTLATTDFSNNQGWNTSSNPRQVADVNGDGYGDIIGFGEAVFVGLFDHQLF